MKSKYTFLLSLRSLEYEIKQLSIYAKENEECFDLLQLKLDALCQFITIEENDKQWLKWGNKDEIQLYVKQLRETAVQALCEMEKYQSGLAIEQRLNISKYIETLSRSVRNELRIFRISDSSKVLFVGSGAFPLSALTIAQETNAEIVCLDIDLEAVEKGKRVAETSGLGNKIIFSGKPLKELSYVGEATHIVIASLVSNKLEILNDLKETIQPRTQIMMRYGNGLKSLFNYPLEEDLSDDWRRTYISTGEDFYQTMIIELKHSLVQGR
ncbi:nicotianamine synthase family protein [Paenibacillus sp. QZ-Y1]|uniref:nicotianamine synthase family protein n=1 Tax=Paenibacillus sp. QZ-Y1 TaxID=3414511 RepID=UPI003F79C710